jgi:hypothetical protein
MMRRSCKVYDDRGAPSEQEHLACFELSLAAYMISRVVGSKTSMKKILHLS